MTKKKWFELQAKQNKDTVKKWFELQAKQNKDTVDMKQRILQLEQSNREQSNSMAKAEESISMLLSQVADLAKMVVEYEENRQADVAMPQRLFREWLFGEEK